MRLIERQQGGDNQPDFGRTHPIDARYGWREAPHPRAAYHVQDIAIWFRSGSSFECTQQIRRKRGARLRDFVRWHQDTRRATSHLRPGGAGIREMILEHNERFARDIARDISLQETSGCCGQS